MQRTVSFVVNSGHILDAKISGKAIVLTVPRYAILDLAEIEDVLEELIGLNETVGLWEMGDNRGVVGCTKLGSWETRDNIRLIRTVLLN